MALVRLGKAEEVWPLLRHSADPRLRSFIVNWLRPLGADPQADRRRDSRAIFLPTAKPTTRPGRSRLMDAVLFHPETSMRRALILALGTTGRKAYPPASASR